MKSYEERLEKAVEINKTYFLTKWHIQELLRETKPVIFDGHFEFCGFHSDTFFRMQAVSQYPYYVSGICREMSGWAKNMTERPDVFLAPSAQGMYFAYSLASETKAMRAVYTKIEPETGRPIGKFIEGFEIRPGEKVVIVNDVNLTGASLFRLIQLAEGNGAKVLGICVFADMSGIEMLAKSIKDRYFFHSVISLSLPFWREETCTRNCFQKPLVTMSQINHLPIYPGDVAYESFLKKIEAKNKL